MSDTPAIVRAKELKYAPGEEDYLNDEEDRELPTCIRWLAD
jgi:hypothetical protein